MNRQACMYHCTGGSHVTDCPNDIESKTFDTDFQILTMMDEMRRNSAIFGALHFFGLLCVALALWVK